MISEETRLKMKLAKLGKPNKTWIGRNHSKESIEKMRNSQKLAWKKNPNKSGFKGKHHEKDFIKKWHNKKSIENRFKRGQHANPETEFKKGKNHPFWKGGKVPDEQIERNSNKMANWRLAVYQRDNYICQNCGIRGGRLEAHHIYYYRDYPEYRFEVWNGQTLCKICHRKLHARKYYA